MQVKQKNQCGIFSTLTSFALLFIIVGALLLARSTAVRAAPLEAVFRAAPLEAVFRAHIVQPMPIVRKMSVFQDTEPAHSHPGPRLVVFPCQKDHAQPASCYGPFQIRQAYGVASLLDHKFTGLGSTIAIIDAYGSPTIQKDLKAFNNAWGLPDARLHIITPQGKPQTDSNWMPETSLDVEWAHALAPDAVINLIVAKTSSDVDLYSVTKYAIDHELGDVLSLSFGENEACADPTLRKAEHDLFLQATHKGVTILAAAGDSGSSQMSCDNTNTFQEAISFPAADPEVTAVGGTELHANIVSGKYISETTWNESSNYNKATGGGYSNLYEQPAYQRDITASTTQRAIPDISLNASVNGGVVAFISDLATGRVGTSIMGGTSVATPEMAGIIADGVQMAHHRLGAINPLLYKLGTSKGYDGLMHDIVSGNNVLVASSVAGYPAVKGWDAATGWGTPRQVEPFLKALIADQAQVPRINGTKHPGSRP